MKRVLIVTLVLVILALSLPVGTVQADDTGYFHTHTCYIYLSQWVWDSTTLGGSWQPIENSLGWIDLRGSDDASARGGEGGYGLFFCTSTVDSQPGTFFLGTDFNADIPVNAINMIRNHYGVILENCYTTNGTIWQMFAVEGSGGKLRWAGLTPKIDGTIEIVINGFSPVTFAQDKPRLASHSRFPWHRYYWRWGFNKFGKWGFWFK